MPTSPGLYIWLVRPASDDELIATIKLFEHATLHASIRGNIRLGYKGVLTKDTKQLSENITSTNRELISDVFFAAGYPLYIGISGNLSERMNKHKKQFEDSLRDKRRAADRVEQLEKNKNYVSDSDDESQYFGARLGSAWSGLSTDRLYVKYVIPRLCVSCKHDICKKTCATDAIHELRYLEFVGNTLFNPIFGRR